MGQIGGGRTVGPMLALELSTTTTTTNRCREARWPVDETRRFGTFRERVVRGYLMSAFLLDRDFPLSRTFHDIPLLS
jgi:hypothetical protein